MDLDLVHSVTAATVAKRGSAAEENEDAHAYCAGSLRFAIADGATDAAYSGEWAQQLVERCRAEGLPDGLPDDEALRAWLSPMRQAWNDRIEWEKLPWYGLEKAQRGAFSSLVYLELFPQETVSDPPGGEVETPPEVAEFRALAVGDSCLFHVRHNELISAFPISESASFDSRPVLLASNPAFHRDAEGSLTITGGTCRSGDGFLLATDALAQWLLAKWEGGHAIFDQLPELVGDDFAAAVAGWRASDGLRNDDTTLLSIGITPAAPSGVAVPEAAAQLPTPTPA